MAIPKIIHQTFKTQNLPLLTRWHIKRFLRNNPDYQYEFYDDARIESFLKEKFEPSVYSAYALIDIGAAKADFFRYCVLFVYGGIYLDIDSGIKGKLSDWILPDDEAIISREGNPKCYIQWALIVAPQHPFMAQTILLVVENILENRHPHDVHAMTGPAVFTQAVDLCLANNDNISYRLMGTDYENHLNFKYKFSKLALYRGSTHWKKEQLTKPVLRAKN